MSPDRLPAKAQHKLLVLADAVASAEALSASTHRRVSELERQVDYAGEGKDIANIEHEISRLRAIAIQHSMRAASRVQLMAQIRDWLVRVPRHHQIAEAPAPQFDLLPGESRQAAITRVRSKIEEHKAELKAVKQAAPTRDEQREAAREYVQSLRASFRPRIKANRHHRFEVDLNESESFTTRQNILGLLSRVGNGELLLGWFYEEIDALPAASFVLTAEEKEIRIGTLQDEVLRYERAEEQLIEQANSEGTEIERREFATPAAVLGVVTVAVAADEEVS